MTPGTQHHNHLKIYNTHTCLNTHFEIKYGSHIHIYIYIEQYWPVNNIHFINIHEM